MPRYIFLSSFVLGAGTYAFIPQSIHLQVIVQPQYWFWFVVLMLLTAAFFAVKRLRILACITLIVTGAAISQKSIVGRIEAQLPTAFEGEDLAADVTVIGLPKITDRSIVFDAQIANVLVEESGERVFTDVELRTVRLSIYRNGVKNRNYQRVNLIPQVGDQLSVILRLRKPRGMVNPSGFDYHAWLLARRYAASGYIREFIPPRAPEFYEKNSEFLKLTSNRWRQSISETLFAGSFFYEHLFRALLLGDKSGIDQPEWAVMQSTGTIHLMAISGLHIGLAAAIGFLLGRLFGNLAPGAYSVIWLPALFSIVAATIYASLAGFSLPTQRALILVVALNLARAAGVRMNFFDALALAAVVIVVIDPFAFMSSGFWLSFGAVIVLIYSLGLGRNSLARWKTLLVAQGAVFFGLVAPLAVSGLPISLAAPIANLIAVPIVSVALVPLLFLGAAASVVSDTLSGWILLGADVTTFVLWQGMVFLSQKDLPLVWVGLGQPLWVTIAGGLVGSLLLLAPRGFGVRLLGGICLVVSMWNGEHKHDGLMVTVMDVGQGLSVVIHAQEYAMVYDTGDIFSESFDIGSRVVVPYLRKLGVEHLDHLIISHGDSDHAGGAEPLMQLVRVERILHGPDLDKILPEGEPCRAGQQWKSDHLMVSVLHPDDKFAEAKPKENSLSCTLLVEYGDFRILLPGDIEADAEHYLLRKKLIKDVDLLVVPHHGSRTSSSYSFLKAAAPELAIISAGYKNRYRHPSKKVVRRYGSLGIPLLNTAVAGAVTIRVNPDGRWQYSEQRLAYPRIWYEKVEAAQ